MPRKNGRGKPAAEKTARRRAPPSERAALAARAQLFDYYSAPWHEAYRDISYRIFLEHLEELHRDPRYAEALQKISEDFYNLAQLGVKILAEMRQKKRRRPARRRRRSPVHGLHD